METGEASAIAPPVASGGVKFKRRTVDSEVFVAFG